MLQSNSQPTNSERDTASGALLQFLLFIDDRPNSHEHAQRIRNALNQLSEDYNYDLQTVEVSQRPDLVEHFRLVATPSLVKLQPEPSQILAGSDLLEQLQRSWQRWLSDALARRSTENPSHSSNANTRYSLDYIRLTDEIFQLQKDKEDLVAQLQFKDQILAMLAHDLRSPLTAASIAVETLELAQNQPDAEQKARLSQQLHKQARAQFRTMNRMITDILEATRTSGSKLNVQPHSMQITRLCAELLAQFREPARSQSLQLEQDVPQDLPPVYADPELIRQVLTNLLENALKYTPAGGRVSLSVLHRTTQKVQVSVCDTGPGIPEEQCELIFEGRFRLKRDEGKEGYGLGLALCRRIVRAHYGQIWVDSVLDQGSCFHFTLPVYR
ncbi:MAG: histidine kinase [Spirulinaceae cyanobacterium SM2_1_0]|nr:histidine kinase [Spirulinaceae cyanobacterium SM2_1_0]